VKKERLTTTSNIEGMNAPPQGTGQQKQCQRESRGNRTQRIARRETKRTTSFQSRSRWNLVAYRMPWQSRFRA